MSSYLLRTRDTTKGSASAPDQRLESGNRNGAGAALLSLRLRTKDSLRAQAEAGGSYLEETGHECLTREQARAARSAGISPGSTSTTPFVPGLYSPEGEAEEEGAAAERNPPETSESRVRDLQAALMQYAQKLEAGRTPTANVASRRGLAHPTRPPNPSAGGVGQQNFRRRCCRRRHRLPSSTGRGAPTPSRGAPTRSRGLRKATGPNGADCPSQGCESCQGRGPGCPTADGLVARGRSCARDGTIGIRGIRQRERLRGHH